MGRNANGSRSLNQSSDHLPICEQAAGATELLIDLGPKPTQNRVHACNARSSKSAERA